MAIPVNTYNNFKIKTLNELKYIIFSKNEQSMKILENAILINGYDLMTYFPAKYQDENKKALLNNIIQKKKYHPCDRDILITRFYPIQLPDIYTYEEHNNIEKKYQFIPNVFDYKSIDEANVVQWHMNFANADIFAYYDGSLLAQDELQVLECPQLASLREYLVGQHDENIDDIRSFNTYVYENDLPYPILVSNFERVIDLDTTNLYGNNFSSTPKATILKSFKYLDPPQITNIIAIEAPKYGQGLYTENQIRYIFQACFTAYSAAKTLATISYELNYRQPGKTSLKTIIHTGWFGCGAYGGNRALMVVLQVLAAQMAHIHKLIFHTVKDNCKQEIGDAETFLKNIFNRNQDRLTIDEVIKKIVSENFQWGAGNGT